MIIWIFPNVFLQFIYFQHRYPSLMIDENEKDELCRLWENLRSERDDGQLRFRTVLLFPL